MTDSEEQTAFSFQIYLRKKRYGNSVHRSGELYRGTSEKEEVNTDLQSKREGEKELMH